MGNKLNHHTTRGYSQPPLTWPHWLNIIYVFFSLLQCSHLHLSQMPASLSEGHPSRLPEYWLTVARWLFEILRSFLLFLEQRWGGERKSIKRMKSVPAQCLPSASQQSSARQGETTLRYWRVGPGRVRGTGRPEDCLLLSCSSMWVNWPVWFSAGFHLPWEKRGIPGHGSPQQSSQALVGSPWLCSRRTELACAAEKKKKTCIYNGSICVVVAPQVWNAMLCWCTNLSRNDKLESMSRGSFTEENGDDNHFMWFSLKIQTWLVKYGKQKKQ